MNTTDLSKNMTERANADRLPADHPLRRLAVEFDLASDGYFATEQTVSVQKFLGAWARARRAWCDYTRDKLV